MKKFHQNYLDRSNESEKKERKIKKHHSEEGCKCFAPFVKLHWHDCPLVNKPCPIHGNRFNGIEKEENTEPIQNVTVSFYPSIKTEKLFQPVKSLLAQCSPETKINFQYYSQKNFTNKENTKDRFIQTNSEDFKRALSNVFVEKTKSFITDKTNKMKKLKQCFYSPCNSIARRSLSQTSVREKTKEISFEEGQHRNALFNKTFEEPFDDVTCDSSFEWLSPRNLDLENLVKLSDEKKDSDFITFTKNSKNSVVNHKIFEIKHKKGLNDISAVKFPKQSTQFVYSTYNIGRSIKHPQHNQRNKKAFAEKITPFDAQNTKEKKKDETSSSSGKSLSSSSGSVFITPFFLMPTGNEDESNSKLIDRGTSTMTETVQVEESATEKCSAISKGTQTTFQSSNQMEFLLNEKPELKTVSIQTEPLTEEKYSQITKEIFIRNYELSVDTSKDKFKDYDTGTLRDDLSDEIYGKRKCSNASRKKNNISNHLRAAEVRTTNNHGYKEPFVTNLCGENIRDQASQTTPTISQDAFCKIFELETHNTQKTYSSHLAKGTQTLFSKNTTSSDFSNLTDFGLSNGMVIFSSSDQQKPELSDHNMPKICYEKSCSDTELYEKKKCRCEKADNMIPLPDVYLCKRSNFRKASDIKESVEQSTCTTFSKNIPLAFESNNLLDIHETVPETQKAVEHLSKAEQTSLKDEYLPQAFSDLSELKKIILKFFENTNFKENNKSDIEEARRINVKTDHETMTDNTIMENEPLLSAEQKPRKISNAETQTTVHILIDGEIEKCNSREPKVKFRQNVLLGDKNENKTFFVCAVCGREISRFCLNASTSTDDHDNLHTIREKTTLIDTKCSKIIEIKTYKKAKNVCTPKELINNSKPASCHIASSETEEPVKTLKSIENSPRDINLQKSCIPILITNPGPAYVRKDRNLPVTESRNVKPLAQEWLECTKSTNSHIRPSPRSPATEQLPKQCVCNETAGSSTSGISKVTSVSINPDDHRSTLIVRPSPAKTRKSKIQPKTDIFPSLPRVEHPGVQNGQWRKDERSSHANPKPSYRRIDRFFYPVSIESFWPIGIRKAWETAEKADNSVCSTSKQKRSYQKEPEPKDIPAGKKIKAFCDDSKKECFLFEKPTFSDLLKSKFEKDSEFFWTPSSSAPQVSPRNDFLYQYKATKSEEFKRISHQRKTPIQVKRYDSDTANELFTVESCHLKPVTLKYDQQPFNNLLECSVCKSLTFMKTNKESTCYIWPKSRLSYYHRTPEESSIEKSQLNQESVPDNPSQCDEEFIQENLDFSDTMSDQLEERPENNIPDEEEEEVINEFKGSNPESNPQRSTPKSQSQTANISDFSFYTDVSSGSEFLNTKFSKGSKKYNFKKHSK